MTKLTVDLRKVIRIIQAKNENNRVVHPVHEHILVLGSDGDGNENRTERGTDAQIS